MVQHILWTSLKIAGLDGLPKTEITQKFYIFKQIQANLQTKVGINLHFGLLEDRQL